MRALELVWFPGSCSRVTLIALEEIGAPFRATMVPFGWRERLTYRAGLPSAPARTQPAKLHAATQRSNDFVGLGAQPPQPEREILTLEHARPEQAK